MNDRFKFRVAIQQDDSTYKRYEVYSITFYEDGTIAAFYNVDGVNVFCLIDGKKAILEQCTGLTDKNGKLIYEGDVLEKTRIESCYKTSAHEGFYLYQKRKKNGLIVEEKTDDKFNKIDYVFRTGETDVATMDRFPVYWLKNESFGWEGEELETAEDWVIIGNIHDGQIREVTKKVEG